METIRDGRRNLARRHDYGKGGREQNAGNQRCKLDLREPLALRGSPYRASTQRESTLSDGAAVLLPLRLMSIFLTCQYQRATGREPL